MLSDLPKLADKAFVLGFYLPSLLFIFALLALFSDCGTFAALPATIKTEDLEKLVYLVLAVWVLAVMMLMFNHVQLQICEGYRWPVSKFVSWKRAEVRRFRAMNRPYNVLIAEWRRTIARNERFPVAKQRQSDRLERELAQRFPAKIRWFLPTRFGNAIRAFETYSAVLYGADSIVLWPHLASVVPKEFQEAVDDPRSHVNCLVNICCFAAVVTLIAAARFVLSLNWNGAAKVYPDYSVFMVLLHRANVWFGLAAVAGVLICRSAYFLSVERVLEWGAAVKATFDCYLPDLAKRLGYALPESPDQQRAFWMAISRRAAYHRPLDSNEWSGNAPARPPMTLAHLANELNKLLNSIRQR
jgi:hypothetical protein